MDQDLAQQDELSARREAMRERLRQKADRVFEAVEQIEAPKTFFEVERAARAIIATDKMILQIFSAPKAVSFDMRFGAADYDERERSGSGRLPVDRAVDAPIVTSSPSGFAALRDTNDSLDHSLAHPPLSAEEDEKAAITNIEDKTPKAVFERLSKRQKRRQRAFTFQGPSKAFGTVLGP